jgi:hypothetical protein
MNQTGRKSAYFTIHPGKNPPPQNGCRLKSVFFLIFFKSTNFTSFTFSIQPDFSPNQPAAITLKTNSPWTLVGISCENGVVVGNGSTTNRCNHGRSFFMRGPPCKKGQLWVYLEFILEGLGFGSLQTDPCSEIRPTTLSH